MLRQTIYSPFLKALQLKIRLLIDCKIFEIRMIQVLLIIPENNKYQLQSDLNMKQHPQSSCKTFFYLNQMLNDSGYLPECNIVNPFTFSQLKDIKFSYQKIYLNMLNKQRCLNCLYHQGSLRAKELSKSIQQKRKFKYQFKDIDSNMSFLMQRTDLIKEISQFATQIHDKKICSSQVQSIFDIPFTKRNKFFIKFLPFKLVKEQEDRLLEEGLKMIESKKNNIDLRELNNEEVIEIEQEQ